jgi:hypothetical protein
MAFRPSARIAGEGDAASVSVTPVRGVDSLLIFYS